MQGLQSPRHQTGPTRKRHWLEGACLCSTDRSQNLAYPRTAHAHQARWILSTSTRFNLNISYRPRSCHIKPDVLSQKLSTS